MTGAEAARVVVERDRILSGPEFFHAQGWIEKLVLPLLSKILAWFEELSQPAYWSVMGALVLAVIALIIHLFYSLAVEARRAGAAAPMGSVATTIGQARPGSADLAARARAELGAGRFAEAVRLAWLAAIAALDAAGISRAAEGRADWEHVAAVRRRGGTAAGEIETLAIEFQRTRWGGVRIGAEAATRCLASLDALSRGIAGGG